MCKKNPVVFISHSSRDCEYVKAFVELIENSIADITSKDIVCTSVSEYGVPTGENIYNYLRNIIMGNDVYMLYMVSPDYYRSAACLNEMGAGWVISVKQNVLVVPGFSIKDVQGAVNNGEIVCKMEDATRLKGIMHNISEHLEKVINFDFWERKIDEYKKVIDSIQSEKENKKRVNMSVQVVQKEKRRYQFIVSVENPMRTARKCRKCIIYGKVNGKDIKQIFVDEDVEKMVLWPKQCHIFKIDVYDDGNQWKKVVDFVCENEWEDAL